MLIASKTGDSKVFNLHYLLYGVSVNAQKKSMALTCEGQCLLLPSAMINLLYELTLCLDNPHDETLKSYIFS